MLGLERSIILPHRYNYYIKSCMYNSSKLLERFRNPQTLNYEEWTHWGLALDYKD